MANLISVDGSSTIAGYGYDYLSNTLTVKFHSGGTYEYENVPAAIWRAWQAAPSKGRFFHENIKGVYSTKKDILDLGRNEIKSAQGLTVGKMGKVRVIRFADDGELASVVNVVTGDVELSDRAIQNLKELYAEVARRA